MRNEVLGCLSGSGLAVGPMGVVSGVGRRASDTASVPRARRGCGALFPARFVPFQSVASCLTPPRPHPAPVPFQASTHLRTSKNVHFNSWFRGSRVQFRCFIRGFETSNPGRGGETTGKGGKGTETPPLIPLPPLRLPPPPHGCYVKGKGPWKGERSVP